MSLVLGVVLAAGLHKTIIFLQESRGQEILCAVDLQMSRQLHGHLIYFWPGGAALIGYISWLQVGEESYQLSGNNELVYIYKLYYY